MQDSLGLLGSTIAGKYRVDAVAGEGGFGVVYRGHHLGFDHAIAIKCLKVPSHFTGEARQLFVSHFAEEGKLLFRLSEHRSIVRVFDHAVLEVRGQSVPYLVLEWLDGESLADHLIGRRARGLPPMSEAEALQLLREPVEGLAFAHHNSVAHRDIKPANLFLVRTSTGVSTRLLDFGVAKLMEEADAATQYSTQTSSGFRAFSPQYGAPEQFFSKMFGQTGPWTDVHAMGLIFTELVTGRPAFDGNEFGEFYAHALDEARPTPRARGATTSPAFDAMCSTALAREARNRYRSGSELLAAMDAQRAGSTSTLIVSSTASEPVRVQQGRARAAWIAALGAVLLAVAAVVAVGTSGGGGSGGRGEHAMIASEPAAAAVKPAPIAATPVTAPPPPAPTPAAHVETADGVTFHVGDPVFVRHDKTTFTRGRIEALSPDHAMVSGVDVRLDDISSADAPPEAKLAVGTIVLVSSPADTYVGKVTATDVAYWDGRKLVADAVAHPIRVRDAWQAPLARALDDYAAQAAAIARAQRHYDPPPAQETMSCADYCVEVAQHERGTPGYNACLAGCQ